MSDKGYLIGIEREGLRIDGDGRLALTSHPAEFGDRLKNFRVGTDFGEAMLELRTAPLPDMGMCCRELLRLTREVLAVLYKRGEYLWPYSMPCRMPEESAFRFNSYPDDPEEEDYERQIAVIYGIKRLSISGIHFNFSVTDGMHAFLHEHFPSVPEDKDEAYMKCCRSIFRCETLIRHFLDASPTDFDGNLTKENSFRNSPLGYRCKQAEKLDFSSKQAYAEAVSGLRRWERYGPVRVKSSGKSRLDAGILWRGISRIELRYCDINPFDICGVSRHDLEFMTALMFFCMTEDTVPDTPGGLLRACERTSRTLSLGLEEGLRVMLRQEESGQTRSSRVRDLILKEGTDGLCRLAGEYGREAALGDEP